MKTPRSEGMIQSVKRQTMSKQVVDQMIGLLTSRQLNPGDKLPTEAELCGMLLVSRPVLREALSSLETMGMIRRKTRDGTYVSEKIGSKPYSMILALSAGDIPSVMEARMALELGLVTLAAEKISDGQLMRLEELQRSMRSKKEDYTHIDKEFHRIIAFSANNSILEGSIDPLLNMYDETLSRILLTDRNHEATVQEHHAILKALQGRDPQAAFTSMYAHLSHARMKILKALKS